MLSKTQVLVCFLLLTVLFSINKAQITSKTHHEAVEFLQQRQEHYGDREYPLKEQFTEQLNSHRIQQYSSLSHQQEDISNRSPYEHFQYNVVTKHNMVKPELISGVQDMVCSSKGLYFRIQSHLLNSNSSSYSSSIFSGAEMFVDDVVVSDNSFWNCELPSYLEVSQGQKGNALYRKLEGPPVVLSDHNDESHIIYLETTSMTFTDLLSHGSIRKSFRPEFSDDGHHHNRKENKNTKSNEKATPSVVGGDYQKSAYLYNFNYDENSKQAKQQNITVTKPGSNAIALICHDCYAYLKTGFELELDLDLFSGIKNFKISVFGSSVFRMKYTAKIVEDEMFHHLLSKDQFPGLHFHISIIPVSISFSGKLGVDLGIKGKVSMADDFTLKAQAILGTQYTHQQGRFVDISDISYPNHFPLKPRFEIDDPVQVNIGLTPTLSATFENCLPLDLSLKPSLQIDISPGSKTCHTALYNTQWKLGSKIEIEKLHFLKWSVGLGVLPASLSEDIIPLRPLHCPFCSGCVHTEPILFNSNPNQGFVQLIGVYIYINKLHRDCGHTDISEWLDIEFKDSPAAFCSNGGTARDKDMIVWSRATSFSQYTVRLVNRATVGFFHRHPQNTNEERFTINLDSKPFTWNTKGETGEGAFSREYIINTNWFPLVELEKENKRYDIVSHSRFTTQYSHKSSVSFEVHMNVSNTISLNIVNERATWNGGQEKWLEPGKKYRFKSPLSIYANYINAVQADIISIPVFKLDTALNQFSQETIPSNGVIKIDTSPAQNGEADDKTLMIDVSTDYGNPMIAAQFNHQHSVVNKRMSFHVDTLRKEGYPIIRIRAPSDNQLGNLMVQSLWSETKDEGHKFVATQGSQVAIPFDNSAESVFVDTHQSLSKIRVEIGEHNNIIPHTVSPITSKMLNFSQQIANRTSAECKWLLVQASESTSMIVNFIPRIYTGSSTNFQVESYQNKIHSYHVPKESLTTKFFFQAENHDLKTTKIIFYDGHKGLTNGIPFKHYTEQDVSSNLMLFEINSNQVKHDILYIQVSTGSKPVPIKLLAVEVSFIDASRYQIKEVGIEAAGYRVYNISIPHKFSQGLSLKCEPKDESDPDLMASAHDLSTIDMTSKAHVVKTRLGKDQLGLSVEDGRNALSQGFFFLAVFSYNATSFAFDINALDAPRGDINAQVSPHNDQKIIVAQDIQFKMTTFKISLYGQFQFLGQLYYDNKTKRKLAQSLKSPNNENDPHGWNQQVHPILSHLSGDAISLDKDQQTLTMHIPPISDYAPSKDEEIVLMTGGHLLTPQYTTKITGITIKNHGSDPHYDSSSDASLDRSLSSSVAPNVIFKWVIITVIGLIFTLLM
eukprot:gb/GECH01012839.1/.p1 GENE.gb/GECH01012839.1/~~gb/GECH01012839.1/.p1  ORF type:complete len:1347 (+),score=242.77 gb/GECH01012839.1/:1-4041(+)